MARSGQRSPEPPALISEQDRPRETGCQGPGVRPPPLPCQVSGSTITAASTGLGTRCWLSAVYACVRCWCSCGVCACE